MDNLDKVRARQKAKSEKTENKKSTSKAVNSSDAVAEKKVTKASSSGSTSGRTRSESSASKTASATKGTSASKTASTAKSTSAGRSSASVGKKTKASDATKTTGASSGAKTSAQGRKSSTGSKKKRRKRKGKYAWLFVSLKILFLIMIAAFIGLSMWVISIIDFSFGDDLSSLNLNISSKVYYLDDNGDPVSYAQFNASENRVWVSIDKMPKNIKNAFVAIEDQRFYKHHGFDFRRTASATFNYLYNGDSSYGGSTITQQLVKNITKDNSKDASRKVREITRSVVLETKLSKEQILEMYLNTIYLSQGANGVEAAANVYFSKSVSELTLSECACIAGITQFPSKYDPITNPKANEEKRKLVLKKMLELKYITKAEYNKAVKEKIVINQGKVQQNKIQSYFLDHLFEEVQQDLMEKGYTKQFAANMIYNGGLKIYCTVNPKIQSQMEDYFENPENFKAYTGDIQPQAAMVISDAKTGQIKGIVGGRGEKNINRSLNRATQTKRQPGSSIKPIAVYGPAMDCGIITPSTTIDDSPLKIGNWTPKNANGTFRGKIPIGQAVTWSYNIPAIRVLEEVGVNRSFDYVRNRLHVSSLVDLKRSGGKEFSDKNLPCLALGGLTDGVTVLEMTGAYGAFANNGKYTELHTYTKVYDVEGKLLLDKTPYQNQAFSPATAYNMNQLLESVVTEGTGVGAKIPDIDTCGKTGTTDKNKDRWFIGYTPYYVASVWFGYDEPKAISSSDNPALTIWKGVMSEVHEGLAPREFKPGEGVVKRNVCNRTGKAPGSECAAVSQYTDLKKASEKCSGKHGYIGTRPYMELEDEDDKDSEDSGATGDESSNSEGSNDTFAPEPVAPETTVPAPPAA